MITQPVRSKVVLKNTTVHNSTTPGMAGKVLLIGAFPSSKKEVSAFTSLAALRRYYGISKGTASETQFDGALAAKRIFMEGISGYSGATNVTCVNVSDFSDEDEVSTFLESSSATVSEDEDIHEAGVADAKLTLTIEKLYEALTKIAHESMDMIFISSDLRLTESDLQTQLTSMEDGEDVAGVVKTIQASITADRNITDADGKPEEQYTCLLTDVYNYIIDFVDDRFTTHRPVYYIGTVQTNNYEGQDTDGITSSTVNVLGEYDSDGKTLKEPGVEQIAECFDRESNEITTAFLCYQAGSINGEAVDPFEFAAHFCGWIASVSISEDLTQKEIPGVTSIDEEAYFGEHDAGYLINSFGVNVVEPKSRINNTYRLNNSFTPAGWHVNHIRSVAYLLTQYELEAGLGITNLETQLEAFKASLNATTKKVLALTDVITEVSIDDINVINAWEVQVPINIELAGIVTVVHADINMSLAEYVDESTTET